VGSSSRLSAIRLPSFPLASFSLASFPLTPLGLRYLRDRHFDLSPLPVTSFGLASLLLDARLLQFIAYQDSLPA
jgi:hypothetical protein